MIDGNLNDVIFGLVTAAVVIIVIVLGMGIRSPTEDTVPQIEVTTNTGFFGGVFSEDVISLCILIALAGVCLAVVSLLQKRGWL